MVGALPPLASIRAFEAAARLGSFAKAAAELGTTPASVSYHVRQLERQIGMALFYRHAQRVSLTAEGAAIAPEVGAFFASLRATFTRANEAYESRLSLTTLPTFGASWLTPRLGRFRALNSDISVELDLSETAHELGAGGFDAAIRNGRGKWPGLRAVRLFDSVFTPLCSPALVEAARGIADPGRRLDAPLLGRIDWWKLWYKGLGFNDVDLSGRFGMRLQTEHLDAAAAIAGQGITIGSPILFADEIGAGRLARAHDFVARDGRQFWLAYPIVRERSRKLARFREWLCDEVARADAARDL
jgi:LysR family glycine cleavage system transcriptional activator